MGRGGRLATLQQRRRSVWDHGSGLPQQPVRQNPLRPRDRSNIWVHVLLCCDEVRAAFMVLLFLLRIVAARLNGSLDFFTVEIKKPLCLLQYRGESPSPRPCVHLICPRTNLKRRLSSSRRPRSRQRAALALLQQRGRDQLPAHALRAVRPPEAHHGAASGRREGRHRQPGPHCPGNTATPRLAECFRHVPTRRLLILLLLFGRFTVWRTRAASSPCRVTQGGSQPSTSTRSGSVKISDDLRM